MKSLKWLMFFLILSVAIAGAIISCGDDDDDDDNDTADDDSTEDDDDSADDDTTDDDDDTADDDDMTDDDDDDDSYVFFDDFESYTVGDEPGSPWTIDAGDGGTVTIASEAKDGSGNVARLSAPTASAYCSLDYKHSSDLTGNVDYELDVKLGTSENAYFYVSECKEGADKEEVCTQFAALYYNDGNLYAFHNPLKTECATNLGVDSWYRFKIELSLGTGYYSVKVDGADTPCADLPFVDDGSGAATSVKKFGAYIDKMGEADFKVDNLGVKQKF